MRHSTPQSACRAALGCLLALALVTTTMGREWKSTGNVFKFQGEAVFFDGKKVKLKMDDGGLVIPIEVKELCDEDQQYLKTNYPNGIKEEKSKNAKPTGKPSSKPAAGKPAPGQPRTASRPVTRPGADKVKPGKPGISVEAVSLTITKHSQNEAAQFSPPGMHITLLVSDPTRTITGLDSEKSKITECIDDKRTDLTKPASGDATGFSPGALMLDVAPNGNSGTIELHEPQIPVPAATRIRIRGELHVICGDGEKSETVKVPLEIILGIGL
jgi:hypothetical protein